MIFLNRSLFAFIGLTFVFSILNILDGHSTYLVVHNSSLRSERNPFARFIFKLFGLKPGIIILKSVSVIMLPVIYIFFRSLRYELNLVITFANAFYIFVVWNNYRNYNKIKKYHDKMKHFENISYSFYRKEKE